MGGAERTSEGDAAGRTRESSSRVMWRNMPFHPAEFRSRSGFNNAAILGVFCARAAGSHPPLEGEGRRAKRGGVG